MRTQKNQCPNHEKDCESKDYVGRESGSTCKSERGDDRRLRTIPDIRVAGYHPQDQEADEAGDEGGNVMRDPQQGVKPRCYLLSIPPFHIGGDRAIEVEIDDRWNEIESGDCQQRDTDERLLAKRNRLFTKIFKVERDDRGEGEPGPNNAG